jgi:hypothetical protein
MSTAAAGRNLSATRGAPLCRSGHEIASFWGAAYDPYRHRARITAELREI